MIVRRAIIVLAVTSCSPVITPRNPGGVAADAAPDPAVDDPDHKYDFSIKDGGLDSAAPAVLSADGPNCGLQKFQLERMPVEVMLVMDRSRSMSSSDVAPNGTEAIRMLEMRAALDDIIGRTQGQVHWGLKIFPLGSACSVSAGADIDIAPNNHDRVMSQIKVLPPDGATPTQAALRSATSYLQGRTTPHPKYLLLATDGLPSCGPGDQYAADNAGTIAAVSEASAAGFPTFVVGITTLGTSAHDTLNEMAVKGGRARADAVKYYAVTGRDELIGALNTITTDVISCVFQLTKTPPSPDDVALDVDGMRVKRDDTRKDGWAYGPDMKSLELFGPACEHLKNSAATMVIFIHGCPMVLIP